VARAHHQDEGVDPYTRGQQVYAATRALIREGGIEAVTVRAVAARAGIASSSLRNQYRDKDFLLRCVIHECTERFNRATYTFRPSGEPVKDVIDLFATQLPRDEDERANALLWLALVERARTTDDDTRDAIRTQRNEWLAIAGNAVRHLGVPVGAQEIEAQRLALIVEAALAAVCDPVQAVDRSRAIELLRLHAHHLLWLAHATGARTV